MSPRRSPRSSLATGLALLALAAGCHDGSATPDAGDDGGPCAGPALSKGPWVLRATATSASVLWETRAAPGCVAVGITDEADGAGGAERVVVGGAAATTVQGEYGVGLVMKPDLAGTYYVARVDLGDLLPGHCYAYRVRAAADPAASGGGGGDARGRLCAAVPSGEPFRFLAIGDTNPILGRTAKILAHTLPEKPAFVVHTGDIQYYSSIAETWAYWFDAMAPMLRAGSFFPAVGNHESEMPTEYQDYQVRLFGQPSTTAGSTTEWYRFDWGGVSFHSIDTEEPYDSGSPQYQWLLASLREAAAQPGFRFSVVYMHRNLYTLGDTAPQVDQRRSLAPIFAANKVRLVLSGHMHGYERFEVGDITYLTTGGGGGLIKDVNANVPNYPDDVPLRVKAAAAYHATLVEVRPDGAATVVRGRAIDDAGALVDEFEKRVE